MQMGCSASKVDNEEVVLMCRERKRFIKQAVDQRYVLAAAHVEYIQALGGIGIALRAFAEGEMLLLSSLPASESPAANSHEKKSPEHVVIPGKSSTSSSLHLHSDSHTHSHHSHSHSHSHSESPPAESPSSSPLHFHEHSESPPSYGSPIRFDYMRSVNTPSRTHEEKPLSPERVTWNSYTRDSQYEMNSFFDIPMGLPPNAAPPPGPSYSPNHPPPPPSPPKNSAWDIFNPFVSFLSYDAESVYPYYGRGRLSPASEGSSHDSKHVREEEGIPDLEEEDQGEDGKKKVQGEKKAAEKGKASDIGSPGSVVENSTRSVAQPNPDESIEEKVPSKGTEGEDGEKAEGKTGDMAVDKAVLENRDVNEDDSLALSVTQGTRNVVEVLTDVENEFKRAQDSGKEVAKMLEANKVPYRPRFTILKALSARVLNAITWHQARPSVPSSSKRPRSSKPKKFADDSGYDFDEDCGMVSGSHSSTLDKIYVWEKKLYEEVKAGEKIRIEYERKVLQLKHQDDKGEDPHLVDATRTATKNLQTKINVAIQVVDSISKRIHTLRDEELQPQVAELIEGFVRMWRVMFDCHQKQNKIISGAKSLGRVAASGVSSETHLKATMHLENELHNWRACFSNWIGAQRAYVQALNGWLLKCLHQEPEETPDGTAPFSPRRVGAPPVFIICNDWSQAFDTFPESEVSNAIEKFAAAVKGVVEHQDEEQRQKRRTEFLKDDLNRRVQTLQRMESRLHEPQPSDKKIESDIGQASAGLAEQKISLDALRRQVEQENAKHHNVMQETRNVTLNTLQSDLKLVFEAMTEFTVSSLKTYEQLSVHSGRENLPQVNGERGRDSFSHANGETSHMKDA